MSKVKLTCCNPSCDNIVERWPSQLSESRIVYCCRECQEAARRERVSLICNYCGKHFERVPSRVKADGNYCCPEHFYAHQRQIRQEELGDPPLCACGCGKRVESTRNGEWCTYIHGHSFRGRHHSKESKEQMRESALAHSDERSKAIEGENNPMWRDGHTEKYYPERKAAGWTWERAKEMRESLIAERGNQCERCGASDKPLELHHIDHDLSHNEPSNFQLLCRSCHMKATIEFIEQESSD